MTSYERLQHMTMDGSMWPMTDDEKRQFMKTNDNRWQHILTDSLLNITTVENRRQMTNGNILISATLGHNQTLWWTPCYVFRWNMFCIVPCKQSVTNK